MKLARASLLTITTCLILSLLFLNWGCAQNEQEFGVVARVNGEPITLSQLEARFDLLHLEWSEALNPSVESLRSEYGHVLESLIIQELVDQELKKRSLEVTSRELAEAEEEIRSDYPQGVFEEVLIEEYIDLDIWRRQVRHALAREKLLQEVLRPEMHINYQEVADYYEKHIFDFYLPAQLDFLVLQSKDREAVYRALKQDKLSENWQKLQENADLNVNKLQMRIDRIPSSWHEVLKHLKPGQHSAVFAVDNGFISLILFERQRGKILKLPQAYPLVEEKIWKKKLKQAFAEWIEKQFLQADIQITPLLKDWYKEHEGVEVNSTSKKNKLQE